MAGPRDRKRFARVNLERLQRAVRFFCHDQRAVVRAVDQRRVEEKAWVESLARWLRTANDQPPAMG
jgi:hypothetical protein